MALSLQGIYAIQSLDSGKMYVGSSTQIQHRLCQHKSKLKIGKHHSRHLQAAWKKYGRERFSFFVLEFIDNASDLVTREQFWVDLLDTNNPDKGYTQRPVVSSRLGVPQSEETRRRISEAGRGRIFSDETRRKQSIALKGRTFSPETLERMSEAHKGKRHSEISKEKIAAALRGRKHTPETRALMSDRATGKVFAERHKNNLSKALTGRKLSETHKANSVAGWKKAMEDPAKRAKHLAGIKKYWDEKRSARNE